MIGAIILLYFLNNYENPALIYTKTLSLFLTVHTKFLFKWSISLNSASKRNDNNSYKTIEIFWRKADKARQMHVPA